MTIKKKKTNSVKALENALVSLLEYMDMSEITIQRLCNEADINRSTYYLHFHDLNQLVVSIERELKENIAFHLSGKEGLNANLISLMEYIEQRQSFFKIFLDPKNHGDVKRYLDHHVMEAIEKEYEFKRDTIGNHYLKVFIISGLWYMTFDWIESGCVLEADKLADMMVEFVSQILQ